MTASVVALPLIENLLRGQGNLDPEAHPNLWWGQGTPAGTIDPWLSAQKGSLYMQVDATDDTSHIWQKVDEGNDADDWVLCTSLGAIVNADVATGAAIVGSKLAAKAQKRHIHTRPFDVDSGNGTVTSDIFMFSSAITVTAAKIIYTVATDTTGAASGHVFIGTTAGGTEVASSTSLEVAKAIGTTTTITIGAGAVAANTMLCVTHHGVAATEAGEVVVMIEFTIDD